MKVAEAVSQGVGRVSGDQEKGALGGLWAKRSAAAAAQVVFPTPPLPPKKSSLRPESSKKLITPVAPMRVVKGGIMPAGAGACRLKREKYGRDHQDFPRLTAPRLR